MKMTSSFALCLFLALGMMGIVPSSADDNPKVSDSIGAMMYLSKYGYMADNVANPKAGSLISGETLTHAIKEFQAFANLNVTGELDNETIFMMNLPRCGVKDKVGLGSKARRKKRYALQGSRWRVKLLTYQITKYPRLLTKAEVNRDIRRAFDVWEKVADLRFLERANDSQTLHIDIRFESAEHGDGDAFDGVGGTLAHAFFPIYGGDVHFDNSELWTVSSFKGTNLFQVAAHEFGHSLGLSHSDNQGALMAAFYRGYQPNFKLHEDDIKAMQALYGGKKTTTEGSSAPSTPESPSATPAPKPGSNSLLCTDPTFDAIVSMVDKDTYVFKGNQYYKLTDNGIAAGYPRDIGLDFGGLEGNLDAAFTWTNGKTYFFKDSRYWRFSNLVMDGGYPKEIKKGFAGIPNNLDTAFVWSGNGKIYFMKGTNYWRFDPSQRPPVMETYPKLISNWEGLPNNIDGALQYAVNGYTYFFKGPSYYRFNDRAFKVDNAEPKFPRPTSYWWFGCSDQTAQVQSGLQGAPEKILPLPGAEDVFQDNALDAAGLQHSMDQDNGIIPPPSRPVAIREVKAPNDVSSKGAIWKFKSEFWWKIGFCLTALLFITSLL